MRRLRAATQTGKAELGPFDDLHRAVTWPPTCRTIAAVVASGKARK
jgi:hypothetical protein